MVKSARRAAPASFEEALAELETIVRTMEEGKTSLEESLASYERGTSLLKFCQQALTAAEQKLQVLEKDTLRAAPGPADGAVESLFDDEEF